MNAAATDQAVRTLRRDLDRAQARIRELERIVFADIVPPLAWELPRSQVIILQLLVARPVVTIETMALALWDDDPPDDAASGVHGHVLKLRRKLEPLGFRICGRRFLGYSLADRDAVRRQCAA